MALGKNILELRKKKGLSQEQLGERVNVTRQTISNWELEETSPNPEQLKLLSKALNVSVDKLIDNEVNSDINDFNESSKKNIPLIYLVLILLLFGILFLIPFIKDKIVSNKESINTVEKEKPNNEPNITDKVDNIEEKTEEKINTTQTERNTTTTDAILAGYTCLEGRLENAKCVITNYTTKDATLSGYACSEGVLDDKKCIITETTTIDASIPVYNCPSQGLGMPELEGTKCKIAIEYYCEKGQLEDPSIPSCLVDNGDLDVYTIAAKIKYKYTDAEIFDYECTEGIQKGWKCIIENTSTKEATPVYKCNIGKLDGKKCIIENTITKEATPVYKCNAGIVSGSKCIHVPTN